jgi:hypothetical protein
VETDPKTELADLQHALLTLTKGHDTLALIYGRVNGISCAWLLDGRKIVAQERLHQVDSWLIPKIWSGLDVAVETRARLTPRARSADGDCKTRKDDKTPHYPRRSSGYFDINSNRDWPHWL